MKKFLDTMRKIEGVIIDDNGFKSPFGDKVVHYCRTDAKNLGIVKDTISFSAHGSEFTRYDYNEKYSLFKDKNNKGVTVVFR